MEDRTIIDTTPQRDSAERLSDSLARELDQVLGQTKSTAELWQALQKLGAMQRGDEPLPGMLRNAVRTELARRELEDAATIHALVEEALLTGDLRPYWGAREAYRSTSPELTSRLFPHERDDGDGPVERDPSVPDEDYETARRIIREQIAAIEETTPTGSMIEAFTVLEDAIEREEPARRAPLRYALELERERRTRTARNLVRTRLALTLTPGRSYEHFLVVRAIFADLSADDRTAIFPSKMP